MNNDYLVCIITSKKTIHLSTEAFCIIGHAANVNVSYKIYLNFLQKMKVKEILKIVVIFKPKIIKNIYQS